MMNAVTTDLVFDGFDYQGEIPETLNEGEVYSVRMVEDDGDDVKDVPLFIRKHLVDQEESFQDFLSSKSFSSGKAVKMRRKLYVTGPPGCGKTAFTTLLAHRYAAGRIPKPTNEKKRVLMILFRFQTPCHDFVIDGEETKNLRKKVYTTNIFSIVEALLEDNKNIPDVDLCILDGVRQSLPECSQLMQLLNTNNGKEKRIKRLVYTTSLQFRFRGGDQAVGSRRGFEKINFDSFTLADYQNAIANGEFLKRFLTSQSPIMEDILHRIKEGKPRPQMEKEQTEKDTNVDTFLADGTNEEATREYIECNYYYAGGNARFMFENTTSDVQEVLADLVSELKKEDWDAFASAKLSQQASSSVNSLMQQFNGFTTAVSRYVLFEAFDRVEDRLVGAVQAAAINSGNPALKGWAFELQQLHTIKTVLRNNSVDNCLLKSLKSNEGLCFQPVKGGEAKFDGNELLMSPGVVLNSGTLIWCMKWNQGCYDVAFFKGNTLLTLQFTVSGAHSLKLQYIEALKDEIERKRFEVETFIHVGVVGGDDANAFNEFRFQDAEGGGRSKRVLDFTVRTYKSSALISSDGEEQEECLTATHLGDEQVYTKKRPLESDMPWPGCDTGE